jgi:hypothetical protein
MFINEFNNQVNSPSAADLPIYLGLYIVVPPSPPQINLSPPQRSIKRLEHGRGQDFV